MELSTHVALKPCRRSMMLMTFGSLFSPYNSVINARCLVQSSSVAQVLGISDCVIAGAEMSLVTYDVGIVSSG